MPKTGMAAIRKPQLIAATMEAIGEVGLARANVQLISRNAGVTPAIINHYFGGKDGLLEATMRQVLQQLGLAVRNELARCHPDDVTGRLQAIVAGNFAPGQVDPRVVKTWLTFWALSMHEPRLHRLQRVNEQRLLSHLRLELKRILPPERAAFVAQGVAALIDGIWLRGALSPQGIQVDMARSLITDYLQQQLPPEVRQRYSPASNTSQR
ncbi:MAG: transcriptional regulator BetI [Thiothrix sp.]|nr:transcriptional regulator BetI [Thiothrix sp.]HPQ97120.1 transcriptional regulator BetI [Thiolinea sp.]